MRRDALRLTEPLQQSAWNVLLGEVERPMRTTILATRLRISREHLSRQFGAGGAPNLKRVIDLTRIACAAQLLGNPGYAVQTVVRVLHFTSPNHLARTRSADRQRAHQRTWGSWDREGCWLRLSGGIRGAGTKPRCLVLPRIVIIFTN